MDPVNVAKKPDFPVRCLEDFEFRGGRGQVYRGGCTRVSDYGRVRGQAKGESERDKKDEREIP